MSPELSATIETLLIWVLPSLAVVAVGYVVTQASLAYSRWKAQQPDAAMALESAVDMAVRAAEQNGLVAKVKELAYDKKENALHIAREYLKAQGVNINLGLIDAAIEAKVGELFSKPSVQPPASKAA